MQMLSVCSTTVKRTKSGDTIVCWYDFMGVLCWWLSKLTNWVDKIQYYLLHTNDADICAAKFKDFLENECSEEKYTETLWGMLAE